MPLNQEARQLIAPPSPVLFQSVQVGLHGPGLLHGLAVLQHGVDRVLPGNNRVIPWPFHGFSESGSITKKKEIWLNMHPTALLLTQVIAFQAVNSSIQLIQAHHLMASFEQFFVGPAELELGKIKPDDVFGKTVAE